MHVPVVLAFVQQGVREDVGRAVHERLAVGVHLARRHELVVAERAEVHAGVIAHAAPEGLELVPRRHAFHRLVGGSGRVRQPADVRPVDVRQRVAERRPSGAGRRLGQLPVTQRADELLVLAPAVVGEGEQLLDGGAGHDDPSLVPLNDKPTIRIASGGIGRPRVRAMLRALPTGTVTFVFTDIAGSTKLLDEFGAERYAFELDRHREALRTAFARHDGVEVGTEGDAFFFALPTASQALDAAAEGREALERGPIRVRVGIHTGTPLLTDEGYIGMDVHRASRIASAGHGGQVLVSATTAALVDPDRFELLDLGYHRLKDLTRPERIFQLGSGSYPPLKSVSPANLPVPVTPFLGRDSELEQVTELLGDPDVRVLTLTGPGGTGKTRLALQVAADCSDSFPDGRWWVPLAPLSAPRLATSALATVMAVEERPDGELSSDLAARLTTGATLVLLDNAEHLLPSLAAELAPIVSRAEGATFLVTSRAPLHLDAEYEFPVPGMSAEDAELFVVSRAKAVGVELEPTLGLAALCERLDYLPLAMQLVVSRLKTFSIDQLVQQLAHVLDLSGKRDADPRQQTLRTTIEWSHSLLGSSEKVAFRRLSVFAGGATIEAIEDVAEADPETLSALLDQSLIRRRDDPLGPRFWMLETIREFALERLVDAHEVETTRARHAAFYRSLAERAGIALDQARGDWLDVVDAELENLRTTLSWCR